MYKITQIERIKQLENALRLAVRYVAKATEMGSFDGCIVKGEAVLRMLNEQLNDYEVIQS